MSANFTRDHKLVEEITSKGWFANPAGRQGYEVVLLERIGDGGTRYYHSLKPGDTLRFAERFASNFIVLAIDVRHARSFPIERDFYSRERGRKVGVQANVRYRVTDARIVAMEAVDPLGELRDKVIATLNRELARYSESEITPDLIERVIRSVGLVSHLGLQVEDAEILEFKPDSRITDQVLERENLDHEITVSGRRQQATLNAESLERETNRRWRQEEHEAINLTDINVLMHENPEMIQQIFGTFTARDQQLLNTRIEVLKPAIEAYVNQKIANDEDVDPVEITRIMQEAIATDRPQLQSSSLQGPRISWGNDDVIEALPISDEPDIKFADDNKKGDKEKKGKKPPDENDSARIRFG